MQIALLISGGVDSSVALYHMRKRADRIVAYFIKVWSEDDVHVSANCPWEDDLHYARLVCNKFGVPLRVVAMQRQYRERVMEYAIAELKRGATPSPDIFCNSMIKFGALIDNIDGEVDRIVSGHYARVRHGRDASYLMCARDTQKDQTYFLSHLTQEQIRKLHTPLGTHLSKERIRRIARTIGLPNAGRPDSQGLCFLGTTRYRDFISHYLTHKRGEIIDLETKQVLGWHNGFWFYTIGQRRGLGLDRGPWYVVGKDCARNSVFVSRDRSLLARSGCVIEDLTVNIPSYRQRLQNGDELQCRVKIRHGPEYTDATVRRSGGGRYRLLARSPLYAVASGQRVALYIKRYCIGGGRIAA